MMKNGRFSFLMAAIALSLLALGCSERTPIYVGEANPKDFSLSFSHPEEFNFEIPADAGDKFDLALELTYFSEQMQDWEAVPMYYIHTGPDGEEKDGRFKLPVKDSNGEWKGEMVDGSEHDRIFEDIFMEGKQLKPGKHNFKIYGDSQEEGKPILGIVKLTFKVYGE